MVNNEINSELGVEAHLRTLTDTSQVDTISLQSFESAVLDRENGLLKPPRSNDMPVFGEGQWSSVLEDLALSSRELKILSKVSNVAAAVALKPKPVEVVPELLPRAEEERKLSSVRTPVKPLSSRSKRKKRRGFWILSLLLLLSLLLVLFLLNDGSTTTDNGVKSTPVEEMSSSDVSEKEIAEVGAEDQQESTSVNVTDEDLPAVENVDNGLVNAEVEKEVVSTQDVTPNPLPSDYDCALIVGVFGQTSNVERMLNKLQDLGYSTYTESRGNLTLVGAYHNSEDYSARKEIRNQTTKEAWILYLK